MLWRDLGDRSAEERRYGRGDKQCTLNVAVLVQLALDPNRVAQDELEICLYQKSCFREVPHMAGSGLRAQHHHALAFHGNSELTTLVSHPVPPKASALSLSQRFCSLGRIKYDLGE